MREEFSAFTQDIDFDTEPYLPFIDSLFTIFQDYQKQVEYCIFIFCSDAYLLEINQQFLNHDFYTDIITFDYSDSQIEGEIYISTERIDYNSQTEAVPFSHELKRVLIHGCLHLCGLSDKTKSEIQEMREKEEHYLQKLAGDQ